MRPLDDIRRVLDHLPDGNPALERPRDRATPNRKLSALDRLTAWLARWQGTPTPSVRQPLAAIFAGSHGIARHGVVAPGEADVRELVQRMGDGTAPANALCAALDVGLKVFELALDVPTADFTQSDALTEREAAATIAFGMEAASGGGTLLVLAGIGEGGETSADAVAAALFGEGAAWADESLPDHVRLRRAGVIEAGLARHRGELEDPFDILRRLGGREIAAALGAIVAARTQSIPVLLDGAAALLAALLLERAKAGAADHCLLAHPLRSPKLGGAAAASGFVPLFDLSLPTGDGQAGIVAVGLARAAAALAAQPAAAKSG